MVKHPVVCYERSIEVTHETLPNVVDAVLIVTLVHFRDILDLLLHLLEIRLVMVLPDVMQAVQLMRSHSHRNISSSDCFWEVRCSTEVVTDGLNLGGFHSDHAVFHD